MPEFLVEFQFHICLQFLPNWAGGRDWDRRQRGESLQLLHAVLSRICIIICVIYDLQVSLVLTSFEEIKVDSMYEGKVKGIKCWKVLKADRQTDGQTGRQ